MRTRQAREETTLTIASALAVFLGTLGLCIGVLVIVGAATNMSDAFDAGGPWAIGIAGLVGFVYLVRHPD